MFGSSSGIYEDGLVKVFLDIRYGGARAAAMANEYRTRVRGSLREAREPHIQLLTQDLWDLGLPREFTASSRVRIHWSDGLMGCEWFAVPGSVRAMSNATHSPLTSHLWRSIATL